MIYEDILEVNINKIRVNADKYTKRYSKSNLF